MAARSSTQKTERRLGTGARLRTVVETAMNGIIMTDAKGIVELFNPAAARLFGVAAQDMIGHPVGGLFAGSHGGNVFEAWLHPDAGGPVEPTGRRADGSCFPACLSISSADIEGKRCYTAIIRDLSEMRRLQEQVVRSRTLASIGEAAATIAHEIKNPLTAISGPLQVIREAMPEDAPHRGILSEILGEVRRLDDMVRRLLHFAKPWTPRQEACDLGHIATKVIELAGTHETLHSARMTLEDAHPGPSWADPSLFEQVLWNLLQNSADAMPGGGEIRIGIRGSGESIEVKVSDDGAGMDPETLSRIFQPFFSTKARGTGLGLPVCRKIMDAHGGDLAIDSLRGRGTTVTLKFPKVRAV